MTLDEIQAILKEIRFRDWKFVVQDKGDGFLLKCTFMGPDSDTGKIELQHCRKWYISSHSVPAEVVRTAWKAVEAGITHEAAEDFYYKDTRILDPHRDPESLVGNWSRQSRKAPPNAS